MADPRTSQDLQEAPRALNKGNHSDFSRVSDANVLKEKRSLIVEYLKLEIILSFLSSILTYPEVNEINAPTNRGERIGVLLDYLWRRARAGCCEPFQVFMKVIAGVQPQLFADLAGRAPTLKEVNFCVENYVKLVKGCIKATGHTTDSSLDKKIDLDSQHIQLVMMQEELDLACATFEAMQQRLQSHPSRVESSTGSVPTLKVLKSGKGKVNFRCVLLYGRAGIGKTTTMQWLARQWASGRWASEFMILFFFQLKMLSLCDFPMTAIELFTTYSLFHVTQPEVVDLFLLWLRNPSAKILLMLDGLDEISRFSERLQSYCKVLDLNQKALPVDICLSLIQGDLLPDCTIISTSRPFTPLNELRIKQRLEILGLSEAGVEKFVQRKYLSNWVDIMCVLKGNHILMSLCSIPFYCALVCSLLADGVIFTNEDLQTYTRLISFILVEYVSRKAEWPFVIEVRSYLGKLAKLAYKGIFERQMNGETSKLIFNEHDLSEAELKVKSHNAKNGLESVAIWPSVRTELLPIL